MKTHSGLQKSIPMIDGHYYLVRKQGSDKILLVYNFMSFSWDDGTTDHDIHVIVFCDQKERGVWGWNCGTSVVDFEQHVKFEEVLAEVSKEEVDYLFSVMRETRVEVAKLIDANWKVLDDDRDTPYLCMYDESVKYPYFTFWNNETNEQVLLWSDLFVHDSITYGLIAPDGYRGEYYEIPKSVFDKACELHKVMSNKFVRQYQDLVLRKTGVTIPIKEHRSAEIEETIRRLEERGAEMRKVFEKLANAKKK